MFEEAKAAEGAPSVPKLNLATPPQGGSGRVGGKDGEGGGDETAGAKDMEDPDAGDDDYDDRFAAVRGLLSRALLRRQKELMQCVCSLCSSLLLQPSRCVRWCRTSVTPRHYVRVCSWRARSPPPSPPRASTPRPTRRPQPTFQQSARA